MDHSQQKLRNGILYVDSDGFMCDFYDIMF